MAANRGPGPFSSRRITPPGARRYEVVHAGEVIGTVGRFQMSAGQFGSRWIATTPDGRRSGRYVTRDAAAGRLAEQAA